MVAAAQATVAMQDAHAEETAELSTKVVEAEQHAAETSVVVSRIQAELAAWRRELQRRQRQRKLEGRDDDELTITDGSDDSDGSDDGDGNAGGGYDYQEDAADLQAVGWEESFRRMAVNSLRLIREIRSLSFDATSAANARCAVLAARARTLASDVAAAQAASATRVRLELDNQAIDFARFEEAEHVEKDMLAQKVKEQAGEIAKLKAQKRTLKRAYKNMQAMYTRDEREPEGASHGVGGSRAQSTKKAGWLFRP